MMAPVPSTSPIRSSTLLTVVITSSSILLLLTQASLGLFVIHGALEIREQHDHEKGILLTGAEQSSLGALAFCSMSNKVTNCLLEKDCFSFPGIEWLHCCSTCPALDGSLRAWQCSKWPAGETRAQDFNLKN